MLKNQNRGHYSSLSEPRDSNFVQHRHLNRARQSAAAGDDKPLNDDNDSTGYYDEDEDVRELNILKGVRVKSSSHNFAAEDEEAANTKKGRRLDWRLGQKINALMDTGKSGIVLGKGTAKDLKFEWLITPWSECSQPCGTGVGFRVSSFFHDCFPPIMLPTKGHPQ